MRWSMNQITLRGGSRRPPEDLPADLRALRAGGWRAIELWLPHWDAFIEVNGLPASRGLLEDEGLAVSGGCGLGGEGSLFFSQGDALRSVQDSLARRLEQCQALGATHLVVAPGFDLPEHPSLADLDRAVNSLRTAAEAGARCGVTLGIEFLAGARLVRTLPTAHAIARRVDHPNVGVVVDTYHFYASLSKTEDLDLLAAGPDILPERSRLTFVHVSDVDARIPRDLWTVPDRTLPGPAAGEGGGGIPNSVLLDRIRGLGYDADVSLELFSAQFESHWDQDAVAASRLAYERCTALLPDSTLPAIMDS